MTNAGGGSAALNFKIVGGTTAPASPSENTIWVNTSTPISDWIFSASQPSSPTAGLVWIRTGISSTAPFSALKRKVLMVYPASAKQYVSGAWADVTAQSYQNGAWVNWSLVLYEPGNVHAETTGDYQRLALRYSSTWDGNSVTAHAPSINRGSSNMVVSLSNGSPGNNYSGSVLTVNKIDLTAFQKITFEVGFSFGNSANAVRFYVSASDSAYNPAAESIVQGNNVPASGRVVLNVSALSGEYFVGMNLLAGSGYEVETRVTVTRIVCE
jgi:hypothetical protein